MTVPYGSVALLASAILCAGGFGPARSWRGVRLVYPLLGAVYLALHLAWPWAFAALAVVGAAGSWPRFRGVFAVAAVVAVIAVAQGWPQVAGIAFVAVAVSVSALRGLGALGSGLLGGGLGGLGSGLLGAAPGTSAQTVVAGVVLGAWACWAVEGRRARRQRAEAEPWPS